VSIPQNTIPVTIRGHKFLVEFDEYARNVQSYQPDDAVGAARLINIDNDKKPIVVSDMRLEVNQPSARAGSQKNDPGAQYGVQGYAAHYCAVPRAKNPGIVACSFIISGLRVFDIHDPYHPKEIAYFNPPTKDVFHAPNATGASTAPGLYVCRLAVAAESPAAGPTPPADTFGSFPASPFYGNTLTHWAMSAPTFVPERNEVWYSDGMYGFYAVHLTNGVWSPVLTPAETPGTSNPGAVAAVADATPVLPRTGWTEPTALIAALLAFAVALRLVATAARRSLRGSRPSL
jgi:hypothetical protein